MTKCTIILKLIAISLLLAGCATMYNSDPQQVSTHFKSSREFEDLKTIRVEITTPDKKYEARVPGQISGTPYIYGGYSITVIEPCFENTTYRVKESITPSFWLNFFNGFGFFVDPVTANMWRFEPQTVIDLVPVRDFKECLARNKKKTF